MFIAETRTFGFQIVFAHAVFVFQNVFSKQKATKGVKRLYEQQRYLLNKHYTRLIKITQSKQCLQERYYNVTYQIVKRRSLI